MITLENAYENDDINDDIVPEMNRYKLKYYKCFSIVFAFDSKNLRIFVRRFQSKFG